jgi:hypothetical protein
MQLGKTLVGAIIGAALGIGLLVGIQFLTGLDKAWLAIPVGLLTGLGVRSMVSTSGHASYARGALTAILALAAYLGGTYLFSELATRRANARQLAVAPPVVAPDAKDDAPAGDVEVAAEPSEPVVARVAETRGEGVGIDKRRQQFAPWDFAWLTIAALLAYELGRGTSAPPAVPQDEIVPPPDAT